MDNQSLFDQAAAIIKKRGGYREKSILENEPLFEIDKTCWNEEHKIIIVCSIDARGCCVDLVTGRITG